MVDTTDFDLEFYSEGIEQPSLEDDLWAEADSRLRELATGHDDMIGGSVAVEKPAERESAFVYQARVVAHIKPDHIVAVEKEDGPMAALQSALDAVERQVREHREKRSEPWKQP
jgi:ribosome-associated translation inhibitor RaiA